MRINCDIGEGMDNDADIMPHLDMANVACGGHAGDVATMEATVALALDYGVSIGAHVSFADREQFGRRRHQLEPSDLLDLCVGQIHALQEVCQRLGTQVTYVKPHGALYHAMMADAAVLEQILRAIAHCDDGLALVMMARSDTAEQQRLANAAGVPLLFEAFVDRVYDPDGALLPRTHEAACHMEIDAIREQARRLICEGHVHAHDQRPLPLKADTLCIHGDHALAVETAQLLRELIA